MYFPYLRGKQFELLALRELAPHHLDYTKVTPIIEPIKKDVKSIVTMIKAMPKELKVLLIVNPEYGEIVAPYTESFSLITILHELGFTNIVPAFLLSNDSDFIFMRNAIATYSYNVSGYALIHLNQISQLIELGNLFTSTNGLYNIIHVNYLRSIKRSLPKTSIASLSDQFVRQTKNADYVNNIDENFSDEHLYYTEDGIGFGDYLTIGAQYIDGGRLPWAVVIHLTYLDKSTGKIRIMHFVSDSNFDDSDTPGKFAEALGKLVIFIDAEDIHTIASEIFRDYNTREAYPGLGTIKKLSIMHHIELVQSLI